MKFEEKMIDHLNINSTTIEIDTEMGKDQIEKYGFPVGYIGTCIECTKPTIFYLESDDVQNEIDMVEKKEEKEVNKNQFYSTERGTQTKVYKYSEQYMQTDPLPM